MAWFRVRGVALTKGQCEDCPRPRKRARRDSIVVVRLQILAGWYCTWISDKWKKGPNDSGWCIIYLTGRWICFSGVLSISEKMLTESCEMKKVRQSSPKKVKNNERKVMGRSVEGVAVPVYAQVR